MGLVAMTGSVTKATRSSEPAIELDLFGRLKAGPRVSEQEAACRPPCGSGHEGVELARQPQPDLLHLGHLPLQGAQHRPHTRPAHRRFHPTRSATRRTNSSVSNGWPDGEPARTGPCSSAGSRAPSLPSSWWRVRSASVTAVAKSMCSAVARSRAPATWATMRAC